MSVIETKSTARSRFFQLLAIGFSHPQREIYELLSDRSYSDALARVGVEALDEAFFVPAPECGHENFEAAFINLFQMGDKGKPRVSLNAADYGELAGSENRTEFLLNFNSWYRTFGLKISEDGSNELPDHMLCQMEFMSWLAHLQSRSPTSAQIREGYERAQLDFLKLHLLPFAELLKSRCRNVRVDDGILFYQFLIEITARACDVILKEKQSIYSDEETGVYTGGAGSDVNLWG